ncbi:50S ribosomal protein L19, partial [Staphylococcus aureus]
GGGDTLGVEVRMIEGSGEGMEVLEGVVIKGGGGGVCERFRVGKI